MMKQKLLNMIIRYFAFIILSLLGLKKVYSQQVDFYVKQDKGILYILNEKSGNDNAKSDTLCSELLLFDYNLSPVCCQNDSLFFVLTGFTLGPHTYYYFFVYKKSMPCESVGQYNHIEKRPMVARKMRTKSVNNKIIIEFNDCGDIKNILDFDPYTMNINDVRTQFVTKSRRL